MIEENSKKPPGIENDNSKRGLVFVYTGNGKGKTTAALGLALRALGYGHKVLMVQFMKSGDSGELRAASYLPNLTLYQSGQNCFVTKNKPQPLDLELAQQGLEVARKAIYARQYDLIILDEINVALDFKLIPLEDVLDLIKNKPAALNLGLTGRYAPREIIARADLVTEMKEIKHPFTQGISAREGFDF